MKQDSLIICPKFCKTFKSHVTTDQELIDNQGRESKVKLIECNKDPIAIYRGWVEFRKLNEVYNQREIMFAYVGDGTFHVKFFKEDPELARVNKQLNKNIQELVTLTIKE